MFQAKQLCLSITRSSILERKPVPVVAKAVDILLTTYSHAIKTGSYYKRTVVEETSSSIASGRPSPVVDEVDSSKNYVKQEIEGDTQNLSYNKSCFPTSTSDSSLAFHHHDTSVGKTERGHLSESDVSGGEESVTGRSEIQSQVTSSAAVSPSDLYNFVFAPVEEEMAGDGSYLMAIIVEFLRRYSWCRFPCRIFSFLKSLSYMVFWKYEEEKIVQN